MYKRKSLMSICFLLGTVILQPTQWLGTVVTTFWQNHPAQIY